MHYNVTTSGFEWDERKNNANKRKHGVGFDLASTIFEDPLHLSVNDTAGPELRWVTVGKAANQEILVVVHTDRVRHDGNEIIRIISARRATRRERIDYEEGV